MAPRDPVGDDANGGAEHARAGGVRSATGNRANPKLILFALGLLTNLVLQLSTGEPQSAFEWFLLLAGGVGCGYLGMLGAQGLDRRLAAAPQRFAWAGRLRPRVRWRVVRAAAVVLGLIAGAGFAATEVWARVDRLVNGCPVATQLRVLTTVDSLEPTRELARAFEEWTAAADDGCRSVDVYVYAAPERAVHDALVARWPIDALSALGPRPDVWLPDSDLQIDDVLADAGRLSRSVPLVDRSTVAFSPVVVAVPRAGVTDEFASGQGEVGWDAILALAERLDGGLVRADPASSVTARVATAQMYQALTADGGDQSPRSLELRIERSLDAGGFPLLGSGPSLLCRQRDASPPTAAIITSEQALVRFNRNDPLDGGCGARAAASTPLPEYGLLALYPSQTPSLVHQFARLSWSAGYEHSPQAEAGRALRQWLATADGRQALLAAGLRPASDEFVVSEPITRRYGALPSAPFNRAGPAREQVSLALAQYDQARRAGRVVLAVDTSGSMGNSAGDGENRLAVAVAGVRGSLDLMGARDEFGLLTFPGGPGGRGTRELIPVGRRDADVGHTPRRAAAVSRLATVAPGGPTPLYQAIVDGVAAARGPDPTARRLRALVVLTDGEDTASALTPTEVIDALRDQGVRVFVIAIDAATCAAPVIDQVTSLSGGGCAEATAATVGRTLAQVFTAVWEGGRDGA